MAFNMTVPWKMHQPGAGSPQRRSWWRRWIKPAGGTVHPTLMREQDLDHLGALHDTVVHPKKR